MGETTRGTIRWAFRCGSWTPTRVDWLLAVSCVQPEERERIKKFVYGKDAKSAMAGRLLMRRAVSDCLGIPYHSVEFARTEKNKPYLTNAVDGQLSKFNFNVSHQGQWAVLAADYKRRVGVDVMDITAPRGSQSVTEFFSLMTRQFTPREWSFIGGPHGEMEQMGRFYRIWCLKESYVKALGVGIGLNLQLVEFTCPTVDLSVGNVVRDTGVECGQDVASTSFWLFEETMLDDQHCVSTAIECENHGIQGHAKDLECEKHTESTFKVVTFSDLTRGIQYNEKISNDFQDHWLDFVSKKLKPEYKQGNW